MRSTTTTPSLRERLALEWFMVRFGWTMEDYPRKGYRRIRRELRSEVGAAASDVGMQQALADLGHPRALGERYIAELGQRLPRWSTGGVAAGLALGALAYLALAYAIGTLEALDAMGGGSLTTYPLGAKTTFTHTGEEVSVHTQPSWQGALLSLGVAAVAFALGSRLWRAVRPADVVRTTAAG